MYDTIEKKKSKICFVSLCSHALLTDSKIQNVGGAEIQQVLISKELAKRGYEVTFIIYGENHQNRTSIAGIKLLNAYSINDVNNFHLFKKAFFIYRKMKQAASDIYFYRAGSPGMIPIFCKLNRKKSIKSIASDTEVIGTPLNKNRRFSYLSRLANLLDIKLCDIVISQTEFQKKKLKERYNVESIIIKNCIDLSSDSNKHCGTYILWVGGIRDVKQPEIFLEIAQHFPNYSFVMIGGEGENKELFKKIKSAAENIHNIKFKGFIPPEEIHKYYEKAILLINTSRFEGFPNIFLEAWSSSIPVLSLNVDPDGIISKYNLGVHSKTFVQMLKDIKTLLNDRELLVTMGKNGRRYIEDYHNIVKISDQYEKLIENLVSK